MRMPRTACANSAGSAASPTRPRNVRFGSAFDSTVALSISVPSSSTTPRVRPPRTSTRATGAFRRISAPKPRAAAAMACVIAPMPPMTCP